MKRIMWPPLIACLLFPVSKGYSQDHDSNMAFYSKININSSMSSINNPSSVVITISEQDKANWYATNDGVMGGLSQGGMVFSPDYGTFRGNISLANNGGFSSVYRVVDRLADDIKTAVIDIEGDGQTYQLRLALNINGYRVVYKHDFATEVGVNEQIAFSLNDFRASFRGRIIRDAPPIYPEKIIQVGFLIANKIEGEFALKIHKISFLNSKSALLVQAKLTSENE